MFERIEDLVGGLRDVSNRAAHDLRTPAARLRFQLEGVRTAATLRAAHGAAEGALRETDAILATFDALLDIAEIEAGSTLKFRPVDLGEITGQAVALYAPVAEDAGIVLSLQTEPGSNRSPRSTHALHQARLTTARPGFRTLPPRAFSNGN